MQAFVLAGTPGCHPDCNEAAVQHVCCLTTVHGEAVTCQLEQPWQTARAIGRSLKAIEAAEAADGVKINFDRVTEQGKSIPNDRRTRSVNVPTELTPGRAWSWF
jgi:hypothetical protein